MATKQVLKALQQPIKATLEGYTDEPIPLKEIIVRMEVDGYLYFELVTLQGKRIQTALLKEAKP